jgi:hypothetical protein
MPFRTKWVRAGLTLLYFLVSFGTLFLYTNNSPLCLQVMGESHAVASARLALACTVWNLFAGACGSLANTVIKKPAYSSVIAPLVSALVAGLGFAWLPLWIYKGFGGFLFENTWADVNCFITEGYGLIFAFVVAPILAVATLLCEWLNLNIQKQSTV